MNRTLKRPMFRKGGTPNEGIMSGLTEPRQEYNTGGGVVPGDILTRGGGVMKPNVSSPISTASRFYPPITTTPAGALTTVQAGGLPATITSTPQKVDFMRKLGRFTGKTGRFGLAALNVLRNPGTILAAASVSGPAAIAAFNKPDTLEELQYMKDMNDSGIMDETAAPEDIEAYTQERIRLSDTEKFTPIGTGNTGLFSSEEDIQEAIEGAKETPPPPPPGNGNGNDDGLGEMGTSDFEKSLNEYLPAIESALQVDDEATRRKMYLELAKFGTGLLAQPGGDLVGSIGKAALKPIEGLSKIVSDKQDVKRQAKLIAIQAAIKDQGPGSYGKNVNDIMKTFNLKGVEGRKQAGKIYNGIIANDSTSLSRDQSGLKDEARKDLKLKGGAGEAYVSNIRLMREEHPDLVGKFNKVIYPEDKPTDKEYYVTPEGAFVRYDEQTDSFLTPGDVGFSDKEIKKTKK
tara:strand:+ start:496 stop:1875 length:1380 start_codon:yes stop_codon:yes gene_type:complete